MNSVLMAVFSGHQNQTIWLSTKKMNLRLPNYPLLDITQTPGKLVNIKYPMAGQSSEKPKVGIYNVSTGKTVFIAPKGNPNDYLTNLSWTPDEKYIIIAETKSRSE